jgi:hypothetical protein
MMLVTDRIRSPFLLKTALARSVVMRIPPPRMTAAATM